MKRLFVLLAVVVAAASVVSGASANHSWGGYHWATSGTGFSLVLGQNLTSDWQPFLSTASSDWSASSMLDTSIVTGNDPGRLARRCPPTSGRDEICNYQYGNNGWLGLASIWLSSGHIVQGTVKVNDSYLGAGSTYAYNNSNERQHVICQEVGHTFGLDHQDTSGASFGTCMDYYHNSATDSRSTHPDQGDYDELSCIYDKSQNGVTLNYPGDSTNHSHSCKGTGHNDGFTTVGAAGFSNAAAAMPSWANPNESVYVAHLPNGLTQITYVRWAYPFH